MTFSLLALVVLTGLLGPLLAARTSWRIPVVIGELLGGLLIGPPGFALVNPHNGEFTLLATIGFGLTMVVVGSHVPVRDAAVRGALWRGLIGTILVGVLAAVLAVAIAAAFGTGHAVLYGVLIASSSAALVLPMLQSVGVKGASIAQVVAQIAIADIACIVALPLVLNPGHVPEVLLAGGIISVVAVLLGLILARLDRAQLRQRLHSFSERRRFALELRISMLVLFGLAGVAQFASVSIMVAGFALGLVLAAVGEPRRLARQLFGITEGFFGPIFFVWLGASIDLRGVAAHPEMILLGLALGIAAVLAHLAGRIVKLPWLHAVASAGQLGVPIAAVTLGIQNGILKPGEDAGILVGAVVTIALSAAATGLTASKIKT
ncbi:cation:proton antiporter domain-containing protein [Glaciibacter psychrotolerans]|uniref:Kef-type K+ transport system membrane component KefB n=1 Tax=Glaciibacter psychrotolerans TaxID=670054 RepID=A0A7Z0EBN4_9MICO|nr:Kef-type K+ transport system membrane component KefB [Leifsonia psychrotolerans]